MARTRLTVDDARHMPYADLLEAGYSILAEFEAPELETPAELDRRISKTLDQLPDIYAWFRQCQSYFDHWTDFMMNQHGGKDLEYKSMRQRRDAMEQMASAAKLRYEGTSRRLTQIHGAQEESRMPRGR